jgi:hypothetical protein
LSRRNLYNVSIKQDCPLSPTIFGIYFDKLEPCWEEVGCAGTVSISITLLLYINDIVLLARSPYELEKQLRILKDFCFSIGMSVKIDKTKVMILKSKEITYHIFSYDNDNSEQVNM